jgi:hypothetical protein
MRYQVPQFIDVEDKIFGPLTLKQFIYIAGGSGLCILLYLFLPLYISAIPILLVISLTLMLAFYKINNKPFIFILEAMIMYVLHPKLYIWHKEESKVQIPDEKEEVAPTTFIPKLANSKLRELAWTLDVREAPNPVTDESGKSNT